MLAHSKIEGKFDFNKTPLAPPGIKVIVNEKINSIKIGGYMEYWGGTSEQLWSTTDATHAIHPTPGSKYMHIWWNFFHNTSSCQDYQQQNKPTTLSRN